ncbi:hypothetical protein ACWGOQ_0021355 [Aquimarina sp. M1]
MDTTQESPLTGSFQVEKNKYFINENIWLDFKIENKSEKTVYVFFQKEDPEEIEVRVKESGGYIINSNKPESGVSLIPEHQLISGEQLNGKYLLNSLVEFKEQGIYSITLSLDIEYNPISIKGDQSKDRNKIQKTTSTISLEITE